MRDRYQTPFQALPNVHSTVIYCARQAGKRDFLTCPIQVDRHYTILCEFECIPSLFEMFIQ